MNLRQSINPVYSRLFGFLVADTFTLGHAAPLLNAGEMRLIKDPDLVIGPDTLEADYEAAEADFTDYAAASLSTNASVNLGPDVVGSWSSAPFGITTSPVGTSNTIYGYWIKVGAIAVMAERFEDGQEVNMVNTGDELLIVVQFPFHLFQNIGG